MTARQQWNIVISIVVLLGGVLAMATHFLGDELFPVTVGSQAPPFSASTLDKVPRTKTFADYKGKVVLLNVWATWCPPCREEMPSIERLYTEFKGQGLAVVAVSVDDPGKEDEIREFVREFGLTFEILHDPAAGIKKTYQIAGYPETFIIARDGSIRKKVIASSDWSSDANRALVRELLGATTASR